MAKGKDVDVGQEAERGRNLGERRDRGEGLGEGRRAVERGFSRGPVRVAGDVFLRREEMVGEHDALESGLLADRREFQHVVGMGEGEGLPELHEASFCEGRPGRIAARNSVARKHRRGDPDWPDGSQSGLLEPDR